MIKALDHIGVAVRSLDESLGKLKETLNATLVKVEEVEEEGVKIAVIEVGGVHIELMEPLTSESPVAKFMEKRGEGVHHVAFLVDSVELATKALIDKGIKVVYEKPRALKDRAINFIHPKETHGLMVELIERI